MSSANGAANKLLEEAALVPDGGTSVTGTGTAAPQTSDAAADASAAGVSA